MHYLLLIYSQAKLSLYNLNLVGPKLSINLKFYLSNTSIKRVCFQIVWDTFQTRFNINKSIINHGKSLEDILI